jgi:hypothetical protein
MKLKKLGRKELARTGSSGRQVEGGILKRQRGAKKG